VTGVSSGKLRRLRNASRKRRKPAISTTDSTTDSYAFNALVAEANLDRGNAFTMPQSCKDIRESPCKNLVAAASWHHLTSAAWRPCQHIHRQSQSANNDPLQAPRWPSACRTRTVSWSSGINLAIASAHPSNTPSRPSASNCKKAMANAKRAL